MVVRFGAFTLDPDRFELRKGSDLVPVEPQVFALLALLASLPDQVISKDEIHRRIWDGRIVSDAALNSRIRSARLAVDDDGKAQRVIRTVRGNGFRFVAEVFTETSKAEGQRATAAHSSCSRPTVAVLPFENLSADTDQEYFSDAVAGDILSALSKHRWLHVLARNATFGYKCQAVDVRRMADERGIDYVVEGSVRRVGMRIRVTAQLVDARSGGQIWADRYDGRLGDVFAFQDKIAERVAARLEPEIGLAERQRVMKSTSRDLQAWECYHLGVAEFYKFTQAGNHEARRLLTRIRELDPDFGEAHAWWAYAVILGMVYWDTTPSPQLLDQALAATRRALELDDRNAVFYALKARVLLARREYRSAVADNEVAISLNPSLAAAHCGLGDSLAYEGRYDEAVGCFERAIDLSPNDPQRWAFLSYGALALVFKKDFSRALDWAERGARIPNCQFWATAHKVVALAHLSRIEEARETVAGLVAERPGFTVAFAKEKLFYLKRREQIELYFKGLALAGLR